MQSGSLASGIGDEAERKEALKLLARADLRELQDTWDTWPERPSFAVLRSPEFGLVMVRGRVGGSGQPFNLGEATVTRAAVRLGSGEVGHGQMLGRDRQKALLAAIFDALWQSETGRARVEATLLGPLRERLAKAAGISRRQSAATRVNFFTLVRGED